MFVEFIQFLLSGVTIGSIYALVALGFSIIFNASGVINFAQGEFVMLGGVSAVTLVEAGVPLPVAVALAVAIAGVVGLLVERLAIQPAKDADAVTLIIITIGASLTIRGLVQIFFGKAAHVLPSFGGEEPLRILGATILPQSLWVLGTTLSAVLLLAGFFEKTMLGKAMLATSFNDLAARLVGINTNFVLLLAFGLSAMLGALGGVIIAPITYTSYDVGIMLGLKGFIAGTLGGLGSGYGATVGGLLLGVLEALTAGYVSSAYKDALPFVLVLFILFFFPRGLFDAKVTERV